MYNQSDKEKEQEKELNQLLKIAFKEQKEMPKWLEDDLPDWGSIFNEKDKEKAQEKQLNQWIGVAFKEQKEMPRWLKEGVPDWGSNYNPSQRPPNPPPQYNQRPPTQYYPQTQFNPPNQRPPQYQPQRPQYNPPPQYTQRPLQPQRPPQYTQRPPPPPPPQLFQRVMPNEQELLKQIEQNVEINPDIFDLKVNPTFRKIYDWYNNETGKIYQEIYKKYPKNSLQQRQAYEDYQYLDDQYKAKTMLKLFDSFPNIYPNCYKRATTIFNKIYQKDNQGHVLPLKENRQRVFCADPRDSLYIRCLFKMLDSQNQIFLNQFMFMCFSVPMQKP